ncbi:MAG: hypothetical protein AVDCRST_MAG03-3069, partial [uncultured Rubrobacteraceae bacterium]
AASPCCPLILRAEGAGEAAPPRNPRPNPPLRHPSPRTCSEEIV